MLRGIEIGSWKKYGLKPDLGSRHSSFRASASAPHLVSYRPLDDLLSILIRLSFAHEVTTLAIWGQRNSSTLPNVVLERATALEINHGHSHIFGATLLRRSYLEQLSSNPAWALHKGRRAVVTP